MKTIEEIREFLVSNGYEMKINSTKYIQIKPNQHEEYPKTIFGLSNNDSIYGSVCDGFSCTRDDNHEGPHEAGFETVAVAWWTTKNVPKDEYMGPLGDMREPMVVICPKCKGHEFNVESCDFCERTGTIISWMLVSDLMKWLEYHACYYGFVKKAVLAIETINHKNEDEQVDPSEDKISSSKCSKCGFLYEGEIRISCPNCGLIIPQDCLINSVELDEHDKLALTQYKDNDLQKEIKVGKKQAIKNIKCFSRRTFD